jgi:hypothetical protein
VLAVRASIRLFISRHLLSLPGALFVFGQGRLDCGAGIRREPTPRGGANRPVAGWSLLGLLCLGDLSEELVGHR